MNDTQRYELCLMCLDEDCSWQAFFIKDWCIAEPMKKNEKWCNPWRHAVGDSKVCFNCPYYLEHVAFADKIVEQHEKNWSLS